MWHADAGEALLLSEEQKQPLDPERVGYVLSTPILPELLTGYEFIKFFIDVNKDHVPADKKADDYFDLVQISQDDRHRLIKGYSHGMLESVEDLIEECGNPDLCFDAIQIAGTNGKTSTARYAAAILRGEGLRTALYTSPELVSYTERMAQAIKRLYPEADFAFGPATENGFYYDIDLPEGVKISEDDFPAIEAEMKKICKENLKFETYELPRAEALEHMLSVG